MSPEIESLESSSSRQRNILNHQAVEDYLKTIYMLEQEQSPVSTSRIAAARSVKPGSATSMIQRLNKLNLVNYEKHYGVTLTKEGERIALEVIRHHRLVELYLIEALGFSWDEVHEQADILEHVIGEKLEERIAAALNQPTVDPHGEPIPTREGEVISIDTQPLALLKPGSKGVVSRIAENADGEFLRYLTQLGLIPGAEIEVADKAPFEGPITILVDGNTQVVGYKVASSIEVELD